MKSSIIKNPINWGFLRVPETKELSNEVVKDFIDFSSVLKQKPASN